MSMIPNTGTLRSATGSVLGVISTSATAVSSAFAAITDGISMLDNLVKSSLSQQEERIVVDNSDFSDRLLEEKSREVSLRQAQVEAFCADPMLGGLYSKNYNKLSAVLNAHKAAKVAAKQAANT